LKKRKLFTGPTVNGVRDAGMQVIGDDPAWTVIDYRPGKPRNVPIFIRGNVTNPGKIVPRRFIEVLSRGTPRPFRQGSGRLELANAILDDARGLTARVIVNRVWGWHFGQPLVRTPSNFGKLGDRPSHPQLLDDLAGRFIRHGWSLKWLHREIVLSATYRQTSKTTASGRSEPADDSQNQSIDSVDPDNRLLSRMNRRRLEPEIWRDSVLFVVGQLEYKMGGPSESLDNLKNQRRSVYGRVSRQKPAEILRLWDFPDAKRHTDRRILTTTPLQQLYLLNSRFVREQSAVLAVRVNSQARDDAAGTVRDLFRRVLLRDPTNSELRLAVKLIKNNTVESRRLLAHSLLASNEFLFVD